MSIRRLVAVLVLLAAATGLRAELAPLPAGYSQRTVSIDGAALPLHIYKPSRYRHGPILVVLHGVSRNASGYRDYARVLADRLDLLVVAPLFDRESFPAWRYQGAGIAKDFRDRAQKQVQVEPQSTWLVHTLDRLVDYVRTSEGDPGLPYVLLGHSAGAQALSRVAGLMPASPAAIVIANPSTHLWPGRELRYPYGYGGLPPALGSDASLQRYLERKILIVLGTEDTAADRNLDQRDGAMRQGPNRYERGLAAWRAARDLAERKHWVLRWTLVEVPGIGHDARGILASEELARALHTVLND